MNIEELKQKAKEITDLENKVNREKKEIIEPIIEEIKGLLDILFMLDKPIRDCENDGYVLMDIAPYSDNSGYYFTAEKWEN